MQHRTTASWGHVLLASVFFLFAASVPAFGQGSSANSSQLKQNLKAAYAEGAKLANQGNFEQAVPKFEQALEIARQLDLGAGIQNKIQGYLVTSLKNVGNSAIQAKNYAKALGAFKQGASYETQDAYMHYGKGLALVNMDSTQAAMQALSKAVEVGEQTGNQRVAGLALDRIRGEFVARASKALSAANPTIANADTALAALDAMRTYADPNAQAYFYRATAYYVKGQYQEAIAAANQGLELHQGSRSDAAKYHFVIGESQLKLGKKEPACQQFEQAAVGDYRARAQHYLENTCK
ncbi:tetratricopeptide repeat protein [Salisaeta longa]|uniref:tetratricopeptide repeat protein n=1 Tax=Salisaeta longa TaxID=503170 RepID=UPI00146B6020|nr:tetratricopeptide repeat protein [Salisaeta longa]